ncbi:MAG: C25 family peptidase propeptide domain-containing protein, partial [Bacteroidota bacterium]|nr:C25 family peptidase propeptide domain-containing protein [Bacteroidota bacterium]
MKRIFTLLVPILLVGITFGQTSINLQEIETQLKIKTSTSSNLQVENTLKSVTPKAETTEAGNFISLEIKGYSKNFSQDPGYPHLPVYTGLIEVPHGANVVVTVTDYDEETINLDALGYDKIAPVQPSYSKSTDPEDIVYHYNEAVYNSDTWIEPEMAKATYQGIMRGVGIGNIQICPFKYNPATNQLIVLNNMKIDISFENADAALTSAQKNAKYS